MDYALLFLLLFIFTIKLKDFFSKSLYLVLRFYYDFAMFLPVYLRILPVYLRIFHSGDLWCYLLLTWELVVPGDLWWYLLLTWELVVPVHWWDISADRIRMLSSLQFPCLVSSALFTRHSSSLRAPDSNRLPSDLEASSHRTTRVRVGTWLFNQCHYEKRRPPVPLVLRRSTVRVTQ